MILSIMGLVLAFTISALIIGCLEYDYRREMKERNEMWERIVNRSKDKECEREEIRIEEGKE